MDLQTDYEGSGAAASQWLRRMLLQASDWAKKGVQGLPGTFLVTFCVYKKLPVGDKTSLKG